MNKYKLLFVLLAINQTVVADCWEDASKRYAIPSEVLKAIGYVESRYNPEAHERLEKSESIGVMQINSYWFPHLEKLGITRDDLWEPCTNIHVGAYILAREVKRTGWNWLSIGAYNVGGYTDKNKDKLHLYIKYASKVYAHLKNADTDKERQ